MRRVLPVATCALLMVALIAPGISWAEDKTSSAPLTLIGRGGSDVVIVKRGGVVQNIDKSKLTIDTQPGPGLLEYNQRMADEAAKAQEAKPEKAEETARAGPDTQQTESPEKGQRPADDQKAPGKVTTAKVTPAENAAQEKRITEAREKREGKVHRRYMDKDYSYGLNSVPQLSEADDTSAATPQSAAEPSPTTEGMSGNP